MCVCIYTYPWMDKCVYICFFFFHSCVICNTMPSPFICWWAVGCFCLAIVSSTAWDRAAWGFLYLSKLVFLFSLAIYLGVELLGSTFSFWGNSALFFYSGCTFIFPQTLSKCSLFLISLPAFDICRLFEIAMLTDMRWYLVVLIYIL